MGDILHEQAQTFRDARLRARMTQRHLAEAARVSAKTVMRAERGDAVSDENVRALCAVLEINMATLPVRRTSQPHKEQEPTEEPDTVEEADFRKATARSGGTTDRKRWIVRGLTSCPPLTVAGMFIGRYVAKTRCAVAQVTNAGIAIYAAMLICALYVGHEHGLRYGLAMHVVEKADAPQEGPKSGWLNPAQAAETHHNEHDVAMWVADSVSRAYSLDFANYRREMMDTSDRFTNSGWIAFRHALDQSGILHTILDKKYVMSAVPTGTPVIVSQGVIGADYAWSVQVPFLVAFQGSTGNLTQNLMVDVTVVEQEDASHSLGIAKIIAE